MLKAFQHLHKIQKVGETLDKSYKLTTYKAHIYRTMAQYNRQHQANIELLSIRIKDHIKTNFCHSFLRPCISTAIRSFILFIYQCFFHVPTNIVLKRIAITTCSRFYVSNSSIRQLSPMNYILFLWLVVYVCSLLFTFVTPFLSSHKTLFVHTH